MRAYIVFARITASDFAAKELFVGCGCFRRQK